jgi:hypothetical protein
MGIQGLHGQEELDECQYLSVCNPISLGSLLKHRSRLGENLEKPNTIRPIFLHAIFGIRGRLIDERQNE